ncbi:hypothetical protein APT_01196 [Acetobacter pasteurianus NBRC 101655]|uniref:hypothetical protein n=1 Tax=Acetobacter pasteurianus TaxID=438 RepID=UPI0002457159|nr:hypothetical protein [Acetobacter pasteurianus]BAU38278.1 hypothetical protein APT_01196 [Acetobacter pasteurianus NBRC 101655]
MTDELKQSLVDIVHHLLWSTITPSAASLVFVGLCLRFPLKNWFLNWVQNQVSYGFNQKLEAYKSDLQGKLESYKNGLQADLEVFKIATTQAQDRRARSNEKEYDACIECWNSLYEAFFAIRTLSSSISAPISLNQKPTSIVKEILEDYNLPKADVRHIINSSDKDGEFSRCLRYKNILDTNKKIGKAKDILNKNGIFFSEDLYNEFLRLINIMHGAWAEQHSIFNSPNFRFEIPNTQNLVRNGEKLIDTIRKILRTNLHIRPVDFTNRSQRDALNLLSEPHPVSSGNLPTPEEIEPQSE